MEIAGTTLGLVARHGDVRAVEALTRHLEDEEEDVRQAATGALGVFSGTSSSLASRCLAITVGTSMAYCTSPSRLASSSKHLRLSVPRYGGRHATSFSTYEHATAGIAMEMRDDCRLLVVHRADAHRSRSGRMRAAR